jgi:methylisocitrate lyase
MKVGESSSSNNLAITITVEKDGFYEVNGTRQEPTVSLYMIAGASKLRRMLRETNELIVCPGVYDGLSARIAMQLGFKGLYMVRLSPTEFHHSSNSSDWCGNYRLEARNG